MTTEIAVINKLGVALATDSAVTVSGDRQKVFDTGDKLFELCAHAPIAVMINGNMDLLGVPWEIIIKDFRDQAADETLSIREWLDRLLAFASTHKAYDAHHVDRFIEAIADAEFVDIKRTITRRIYQAQAGVEAEALQTAIADEARAAKQRFDDKGRAGSLKNLRRPAVLKAHSECIDALITRAFAPVPIEAATRDALRDLIGSALLSAEGSDYSTGVIVAGYGEKDMFPSLAMAEVDGVVSNRIKYTHRENIRINRSANPGRVISFAQADVVERLLSGVDEHFIIKSSEFIQASFAAFKEQLQEALMERGMEAAAVANMLTEVGSVISDEYVSKFAEDTKKGFEANFNQTVALMPKRDIIELAEALVSITAIERKASLDLATVGGPVDVAFITRHEGFVWIKRKHYFDPDLNPRYFWRKFRVALEGD